MVKLPDGNYMTAYLDDVYYIKYLIAGSVQLPLGTAERMTLTEQEDLKTYITEYSLNSEYLLMMFCQMRYENLKIMYYVVPVVLFIGIIIITSVIESQIEGVIKKKLIRSTNVF